MAKPDWITLDKSSGTGSASVQVTAGTNASTAQRSGILTIKTASGLTKTVSTVQSGASIVSRPITVTGTPRMVTDGGRPHISGMTFALVTDNGRVTICTGDWLDGDTYGSYQNCDVTNPISVRFNEVLDTVSAYFSWSVNYTFNWSGSGYALRIRDSTEVSRSAVVTVGTQSITLNASLTQNTAGSQHTISDSFTLSSGDTIDIGKISFYNM